MKLVDMHCHVLPGVDDGARNMEQAISMIKIASEENIGTMVLTPHFHQAKGNQDIAFWKETLKQLEEKTKEIGIEMQFYLGSELFYNHDLPDAIDNGLAISMSDSDYVLMEFRFESEYSYIKSALRDVQATGKRVILAHVERYDCLIGRDDRIEELSASGAYIQVNASSVTGELGKPIKKFVKKLMKADLIDFIATDAHSDGRRAPRMKECYAYVVKKFGQDYADRLMINNALKIVNNQDI